MTFILGVVVIALWVFAWYLSGRLEREKNVAIMYAEFIAATHRGGCHICDFHEWAVAAGYTNLSLASHPCTETMQVFTVKH